MKKCKIIGQKNMIKTFEQFNIDIDPYGEEIWDDRKTLYNWLIQKYPDRNTWGNIKKLDCFNNQLTSLEGIENLVNLRELYCYNNQLTSLDGIENLVNIEYLDCSYNQLTSLEGIENLVNLERLYCYNNQLTSLENIENLVNLERLYCFNNQFTDDYKNYLRTLKIKDISI
jgi:Leucine-rich repeat (LRR) protein